MSGGGKERHKDRVEANQLLRGMRNQNRASCLALKHSAAEIIEAFRLAGLIRGVRDAAGMAASLLDDGSAAASLTRRTETAEANKTRDDTRADDARRALESQDKNNREREAQTATIRAAAPDVLRTAIAEVIPTVPVIHRHKFARELADANGTAEAVVALALRLTLRPAVAERLLTIQNGTPRVVPEAAA